MEFKLKEQLEAAAQLQVESLMQVSQKLDTESVKCKALTMGAEGQESQSAAVTNTFEYKSIGDTIITLSLEWITSFKYMNQDQFNTILCQLLNVAAIGEDQRASVYKIFKLLVGSEESRLKAQKFDSNFHKLGIQRNTDRQNILTFLTLVKHFPESKLIEQDNEQGASFLKEVRNYVARLPHKVQVQDHVLVYASRNSRDKLRENGPVEILVDSMKKTKRDMCIIPVGRSGMGKSCLINEFLKLPKEVQVPEYNTCDDEPVSSVTANLIERQRKYKDTVITLVDTPGLECSGKAQQFAWDMIINRILDGFSDHSEAEPVDLVWFCLPSALDRLDDIDSQWIRTLSEFLPVILVFPKAIRSSKMFEHQIKQMKHPLPIHSTLRILARDDVIDAGNKLHVIESYGLGKLARRSSKCLTVSEELKKRFIACLNGNTEKDYATRKRWGYSVIAGAAASAIAVGATPIPFADVSLLAPIQVGMISALIAIYGLRLDRAIITGLATSLLTTGLASLGGPSIAIWLLELGKVVPIINFGASIICGGLAAGVTLLIGMSTVAALELLRKQQGNLLGIDHRKFEFRVVEEMKNFASLGTSAIAKQFFNVNARNDDADDVDEEI